VKHGFFDNQRFYRVTPAYIQFGYHADRVVNENIYQCVSLAAGVCVSHKILKLFLRKSHGAH
jgi:hypothetical protein